LKKLKSAFSLLFLTVLFGVLSYRFVESMPWFDSLYMTIITMSTVGYKEVHPLSTQGRVITIFLIVGGISIAGYTLGTFLRMFIEGELRKTFGRRKVEKKISLLKGHYIICGYGRIGSLICNELKEHNIKFVVIENNPLNIEKLEEEKYLFVQMDATDDNALIKAGIEHAKGIVTAVQSDSDNVFITLTARGLNPNIFVLARTSDEKNEIKLKRAGANRVVSPYLIGGQRMAQVLIRPTVVDFIDIAVMESKLGLQMEEMIIEGNLQLVGKNLIESKLRNDYGVIIVLIKKFNGEMIFNPKPTEILEKKDVIVMLGQRKDFERMKF